MSNQGSLGKARLPGGGRNVSKKEARHSTGKREKSMSRVFSALWGPGRLERGRCWPHELHLCAEATLTPPAHVDTRGLPPTPPPPHALPQVAWVLPLASSYSLGLRKGGKTESSHSER